MTELSAQNANESGLIKVAVAQMRSGMVVADNLAQIEEVAGVAAAAGAQYLQVPEMALMYAESASQIRQAQRDFDADALISACAEIAQKHRLFLHIGSMAIALENGKFANRSFVFADNGEVVATYDKIHLFDADIAGSDAYRESRTYVAGADARVVDLKLNGSSLGPGSSLGSASGPCFGLSICFDLRFPNLFQSLADMGAQIICVPAAFTQPTGEAHWETLLRARAIETGCFVLASAQGGRHENGRQTHGHAMIIDPWGKIIAEVNDREPDLLVADIDLQHVAEVRNRLPVLANRRPYSVSINHNAANC